MNFKNIKTVIKNNILVRNILVAIGLLILLLVVVLSFLKLYTRHGESLTVPDLTGLTLEEAEDVLHKKNFRAFVFDSVYSMENERGTVVEQHPKSGFKVKRKRKIFLTMNAMNPEKVNMPDLVQLTIKQAQSRLTSYGLKLGKITYEPDISVNLVLSQKYQNHEIVPGDTLIKGSVIDLVLGKGLSHEYSIVPDLSGLTLEEATLRAAESFLRIGGAVFDPEVTAIKKDSARIYRQRPEHNKNTQIPLGSSVDVWLTTNKEKIPSVLIDSTYDAQEDTIF